MCYRRGCVGAPACWVALPRLEGGGGAEVSHRGLLAMARRALPGFMLTRAFSPMTSGTNFTTLDAGRFRQSIMVVGGFVLSPVVLILADRSADCRVGAQGWPRTVRSVWNVADRGIAVFHRVAWTP